MLSPAWAPANCSAQNSDAEQEQQGTGNGVDHRRGEFRSRTDVQFRQEPAADDGSANSHHDVTENSESYPSYKMTHQPSRNDTDCNRHNQIFFHYLRYYVAIHHH